MNNKEKIASFHQEQIALAANQLFMQKGFACTRIDDISKTANYSRKTIYAYFANKEEFLHYLIVKALKGQIRADSNPLLSVYIVSSNISSLVSLLINKGPYIASIAKMSEDEILDYGLRQILNSILEDNENQ